MDARLVDSMQGQMSTLSNHEFQIYMKMRSKFKGSSASAYGEAFDDLLTNVIRIQERDNFLKSVPNVLWLPELPTEFTVFLRFVAQYTLKPHIKSIVLLTDKDFELQHTTTADVVLARSVSEIWDQIFSRFDPLRVVVAAPPTTLAGLLNTLVLSSDAWAFNMQMHYIEFAQSERLRSEHKSVDCQPWDSLIYRRPWSHLGYNEGSSITAYSTYEYHLKKSPKVLYLVLLRLTNEGEICCNITSFSFVGVFPIATNLITIIRALRIIPTIQKTFMQLAPGPENNLLSDAKRRGRAQSSDFWLEWRESYKVLATYLGVVEFEDGSEFSSGDCENVQLRKEIGDCMKSLWKRGVGWRRRGDATWARDRALDTECILPVIDPVLL